MSGSALNDANFIIAQPPAYSDPNALSQGYCAFHDYTLYGSPGNSYYKGISTHLSYTNIPYQLAINAAPLIGSGESNVCGEYAVNNNQGDHNPMTSGKLDGFSIVLGHEIEETITDPGAEDILGNATTSSETYYGSWYDPLDANENGDKCAWVGENLITGQGPPEPIYGSLGNIKGNTGETFAVQSLWSNAANEGTGYCAGVPSSDSPIPSAAYGSSSNPSGSSGGSSAKKHSAPSLSKLSVSPRRFNAAGRKVRGRCVKATRKNKQAKPCQLSIRLKATYTLNRAIKLSFKLARETAGRKVSGRCVGATRKNKHHSKCTALISVHKPITRSGVAGRNTFRFAAKLAAGTYRLTVTPAGGSSRSVIFRVTG